MVTAEPGRCRPQGRKAAGWRRSVDQLREEFRGQNDWRIWPVQGLSSYERLGGRNAPVELTRTRERLWSGKARIEEVALNLDDGEEAFRETPELDDHTAPIVEFESDDLGALRDAWRRWGSGGLSRTAGAPDGP
jgi:hypothetical protein